MGEIIDLPKRTYPAKPGYVWMPTFEGYWNMIEGLAKLGPEIALLIGGAGMGKTEFLRVLESRCRRRIVLDPAAASLRRGMLRTAEAMGYDHSSASLHSTYRLQEEIIMQIGHLQLGAGHDNALPMLLFDEAQFASAELIESLRYIHDKTGICMLFAGNPEWREQLMADRYEAFFTRSVTLRIKRLEPADIAAFCRHHQIAGAREQAFLEQLAARPGALRAIAKVAGLARDLAGKDGPIRLEHLREAAARRTGPQED